MGVVLRLRAGEAGRGKLSLLARLLNERPGELRADFQRYYGLNIDGMGVDYTMIHAADLAAHLPMESATMRAEAPELEWTMAEYLLASIEYSLRVLRWQNTEDGQKGVRHPRPIDTPADFARIARKAEATDMEYIAEKLGIRL